MSLEMIKHNARSIAEIMDKYNDLVNKQMYLVEKRESNDRINAINGEILQLKSYFLKLVASIDSLARQEEQPLIKSLPGKHS